MEKFDKKMSVALDTVTVPTQASACQKYFNKPEERWNYFVTSILPNSLTFQK